MKEDASRRFNGRFKRVSDPSRAMLSSRTSVVHAHPT